MSDSKQDEFMKYLEKSGVVDSLTKVLVSLYEASERPSNAIDFIKESLGNPSGVEQLRGVIEQQRDELQTKNEEIEQLRNKLSSLSIPSSSPSQEEEIEEKVVSDT